jgi:thiamine biosynthesis lipoprotein
MNRKTLITVLLICGIGGYFLFVYFPFDRSCSFYSMGGILTEIKAYGINKKQMDSSCVQTVKFFEDMENEISIYRPNSALSKVNGQFRKTSVLLPEHTFQMLKDSMEVSKNTYGYYDITVLPVLELWKKAEKLNKLPTALEVKQMLNKISYKKLRLDEKKHLLFFQVPGMKLDLGAIAKGYMVDVTQKIMENNGIKRGLINCGGGIGVFDHNKNPRPFTIKIYNPDESSANQGNDKTVEITNGAIHTSGDYNRFFKVEDKDYSHIINPHTGIPSSGCHSITVMGSFPQTNGAMTDAYGTGFCAMLAAGLDPQKLHVEGIQIIQLKK